jgi:hypothetical protein
MSTIPTDYTDEQLAAGLQCVEIWRKQNGVLSDESLCGMIYDAMRAAQLAAPVVEPVAYRIEDVPGHYIYTTDMASLRGFVDCPVTPLYAAPQGAGHE